MPYIFGDIVQTTKSPDRQTLTSDPNNPPDTRAQQLAHAAKRLESYTRDTVEPNNFLKISSMDSKSIIEGHESRVGALLADFMPRLPQVPVVGVRSSEASPPGNDEGS